MNPQGVIGTNLARLRAERDLSQQALAERTGISRVALGRIERGVVTPRAKTVSDLARALDLPLKDLATDIEPITNVRFRTTSRVNNREQILAETAAWLAAYNWLESRLGMHARFKLAPLVGKQAEPRELAAEARRRLKLDKKEPVYDICGLLENHSVKILPLKKSTDAFFGLSVAASDGGPAIVVNTWDRIAVERWIFTAAHELGHLLLHADAFDRVQTAEHQREEREADQFASHFLMPDAGFRAEWVRSRGLPMVQGVLKLKRIYRVSYQTVLYRLVDSGWYDDRVRETFQTQYRDRFGKTLSGDEAERLNEGEFRFDWRRAAEPDGLSENDFLTGRLCRLTRDGLEQDLITLGRAAEILRISLAKMRQLAASWVD